MNLQSGTTEPGEVKHEKPKQEKPKPKEAQEEKTKQEKPKQKAVPEKKEGIWSKIKKVFLNIVHFPSNCIARLQKIRLTFQEICDKIKQWRAFIKKDSTKQAVHFVLTRTKICCVTFFRENQRKYHFWIR